VGTTTLNISQETIQEFQISTSSSDTSAGISATGAVNVITKRGSNKLHGSGFFFGRNDDIAARPNFSTTKPDFSRKQYGVNLGGRRLKERSSSSAAMRKPTSSRRSASIRLTSPACLLSKRRSMKIQSMCAQIGMLRKTTMSSYAGRATKIRTSAGLAATDCLQ